MSNDDYLDALDNILGDLTDEQGDTAMTNQAPVAHHDESHEASITWATVIERASNSLQESASTVQEAARKNIELGKQQHESIKELSDAAGGWRHTTRQATQEISTAKRHILVLSLVSSIIAIGGFATTIAIMLQSKEYLANVSHAMLENIDEHQSLFNKNVNSKIDEIASNLEMLESRITHGEHEPIAHNRHHLVEESNEPVISPTEVIPNNVASVVATTENSPETQAELQRIYAQLEALTALVEERFEQQAKQTSLALEQQPPVVVTQAPAPAVVEKPATVVATAPTLKAEEVAAAVAASTQPSMKAINEKIASMTAQLGQFEHRWEQSEATLSKQIQSIPVQTDERLSTKLSKIQSPAPVAATPAAPATTTDNKAVIELINRLRQDLSEIRQSQTALKEQLRDIRLNSGGSGAKPYVYRNPDVERYPPN